jgi:predicted nucleic acid-binding protein
MGVTVDTCFLIDLLKERPSAARKLKELDERSDSKILTTPVLFEILTGIRFTGSRTEEATFRAMAARFRIEPFDSPAAERAAEIRAELLHLGKTPGQTDVMIAGIALARGHVLLSDDTALRAASRAVGLSLEQY